MTAAAVLLMEQLHRLVTVVFRRTCLLIRASLQMRRQNLLQQLMFMNGRTPLVLMVQW